MHVTDNLHAFIWQSMTTNNCNAYLIDGPKRVLIDPGHRNLFEHVRRGLQQLDLTIRDIDMVICTHAHPDHLEAIPLLKNSSFVSNVTQEENPEPTSMIILGCRYLIMQCKKIASEYEYDGFSK